MVPGIPVQTKKKAHLTDQALSMYGSAVLMMTAHTLHQARHHQRRMSLGHEEDSPKPQPVAFALNLSSGNSVRYA